VDLYLKGGEGNQQGIKEVRKGLESARTLYPRGKGPGKQIRKKTVVKGGLPLPGNTRELNAQNERPKKGKGDSKKGEGKRKSDLGGKKESSIALSAPQGGGPAKKNTGKRGKTPAPARAVPT